MSEEEQAKQLLADFELEQNRLAELEEDIKEGLATFFKTGSALMEIRTRRLYRETHDSF